MNLLVNLKKKPLEFGTLLTSLIAIILSIISLSNDPKRHSDNLTSETIREVYTEFIEMTSLQAEYPLQIHLFSVSEDYDRILKIVKSDSLHRKTNQRLVERAISNRIFTHFEQAFYLWKQADAINDVSREVFMKEVINYYTGRLLKNPRLLWYWSEKGGNLKVLYEAETVKYYDSKISIEAVKLDSIGPFN